VIGANDIAVRLAAKRLAERDGVPRMRGINGPSKGGTHTAFASNGIGNA
jgi:hypothetical protein